MENLTLFGISLSALILAAVKVTQDEFGFSDKIARWARGLLLASAFVLIQYASEVQALWPGFEQAVVVGGGALAVLLGTLGYWSELQQVSYKLRGR